MDKAAVVRRCPFRYRGSAVTIHPGRQLRLGLGLVHLGIGGGIDNDPGLDVGELVIQLLGLADIQFRQIEAVQADGRLCVRLAPVGGDGFTQLAVGPETPVPTSTVVPRE